MSENTTYPVTSAGGPRRTATTKIVIAAAVAVVLLTAGVAVVLFAVREPIAEAARTVTKTPLETAKESCAPGSSYAALGDGGRTLILQSEGREQDGISYNELECFWTELKVTDAVRSEMKATRALDGRQSGTWGDLSASWSYHPDDGVRMTITMR